MRYAESASGTLVLARLMQSAPDMQLDLIPHGAQTGGGGPSGARLTEWDPSSWQVAPDWRPAITRFQASPAGHALGEFVQARLHAGATIYPHDPLWALALTALSRVKVVILGQDPYHGPGQAQGLAFSVAPGVRIPPSLRNILTEVERGRGSGRSRAVAHAQDPADGPDSGSLVRWARQGVLLLNTCLSVEQGRPGSHANRGWEALTDEIIQTVVDHGNTVVFMLWGAHAQSKAPLLAVSRASKQRLVLTANHPSPFSARRPPEPFVGCGHFCLANAFLRQHGQRPVNW